MSCCLRGFDRKIIFDLGQWIIFAGWGILFESSDHKCDDLFLMSKKIVTLPAGQRAETVSVIYIGVRTAT